MRSSEVIERLEGRASELEHLAIDYRVLPSTRDRLLGKAEGVRLAISVLREEVR